MKLKSLHRFTSTATAVEEITALQEGKLGKGLKKFLSDEIVGKGKGKESLTVFDAKLGALRHFVPHVTTYLPQFCRALYQQKARDQRRRE